VPRRRVEDILDLPVDTVGRARAKSTVLDALTVGPA
jgi:hypothetical protein